MARERTVAADIESMARKMAAMPKMLLQRNLSRLLRERATGRFNGTPSDCIRGRYWKYLTYATTMSDEPMHVPPRHRLDIVSEPGFVVLRRLDGTEVARFTVRGATW